MDTTTTLEEDYVITRDFQFRWKELEILGNAGFCAVPKAVDGFVASSSKVLLFPKTWRQGGGIIVG